MKLYTLFLLCLLPICFSIADEKAPDYTQAATIHSKGHFLHSVEGKDFPEQAHPIIFNVKQKLAKVVHKFHSFKRRNDMKGWKDFIEGTCRDERQKIRREITAQQLCVETSRDLTIEISNEKKDLFFTNYPKTLAFSKLIDIICDNTPILNGEEDAEKKFTAKVNSDIKSFNQSIKRSRALDPSHISGGPSVKKKKDCHSDL